MEHLKEDSNSGRNLQRAGKTRTSGSQGVLAVLPGQDLLIVDDRSPDGTGKLATILSQTCGSVHVLNRAKKESGWISVGTCEGL